MTVVDIMRYARIRAGSMAFDKFGPPIIKEQLNTWYKQYNDDYELVAGTQTFAYPNYDADGIYYTNLPDDWQRMKTINPYRIYRHPQVFRTTEPQTYTIEGNQIKFSGVSATSSFEVGYVSTGKTLVEVIDDADTEADKPEWLPKSLHNALMLKLALWLNPGYDQAAVDLQDLQRIEEAMESYRFNKQNASPVREGMQARIETYANDPYDQEN